MKRNFYFSICAVIVFIVIFDVVEAQEREICWHCYGSGECPYCEDGRCPSCEYGRCPTCDGTGEIIVGADPHFMEMGIFEQTITCDECYGSGDCQKCQGSGACKECYGSGQCQLCFGSGFGTDFE